MFDALYLTVTQAADILNVSAQTLRRWEDKGLLVPERTQGNARRYPISDVLHIKNLLGKNITASKLEQLHKEDVQLLEKLKTTTDLQSLEIPLNQISSDKEIDSSTKEQRKPAENDPFTQIPILTPKQRFISLDKFQKKMLSGAVGLTLTYILITTAIMVGHLFNSIQTGEVLAKATASPSKNPFDNIYKVTLQSADLLARSAISAASPPLAREILSKDDYITLTKKPNLGLIGLHSKKATLSNILGVNSDKEGTLEFNTDTKINGDLLVKGRIQGDLGLMTFTTPVTVNSSFTVNGETTLNGVITIAEATTLESDLRVKGVTSFTSIIASGQIRLTGNPSERIFIQSSSDPTTAVKLINVRSAGNRELFSLDSNGNVYTGGHTTIAKDVIVKENTYIAGTLNGSGATSLSSTLRVSGDATFDNPIYANSHVNVKGSTTVDGNSHTYGHISGSGTLKIQGTGTFINNLVTYGTTTSSGAFLASTGSSAVPSYSFSNSQTTGLYTPSVSTLGISTSGSERVRIDSSGNVGIGDSSPLSLLTVGSGDLFQVDAFGRVLTSGSYHSFGNNASLDSTRLMNLLGSISGGSINSWSYGLVSVPTRSDTGSGTARHYAMLARADVGANITVNDTVGLGVASSFLNTGAVSRNNYGILIDSQSSGSTTNYGIYIAGATGATSNIGMSITNVGTGGNNYSIYSPALAQSYLAGNLGVGTSSPNYKLEVAGTGSFAGLTATGTLLLGRSIADSVSITSGNWSINSAGNTAITQILNSGNYTGTGIFTNNGTGYFNGNLGIGTSNPTGNFEISSSTPTAYITNTANGYAQLDFRNSNANFYVGLESAGGGTIINGTASGAANAAVFNQANAYPMQFATSNNVRMTIDSTGNIGIGTVNPSAKLSIFGNNDSVGDAIQIHGGSGSITKYGVINIHDTNEYLRLGYFNGTQMRNIFLDGNVGVGNNAPNYRLDVTGTGSFTGLTSTGTLLLGRSTSDTVSITSSNWSVNSSGQSSVTQIVNSGSYAGTGIFTNNGTGYFNGNLGIGTSNPSGNLHVAGPTVVLGAGEGTTPTVTTVRGAAGSGTNVSGASITFDASIGSGTGNSGSFIYRTAPSNFITYDNSSSSYTTTDSTTLRWRHTTGGGSNRILVVGTASRVVNISSIKYAGQSLTSINEASPADARAELWYLINPPAGNHEIEITAEASGTIAAGAITYTGVAQSSPIRANTTNTGNSSTGTGTLSGTTLAGDLVVDILATQAQQFDTTPGANQTERIDQIGTANNASMNDELASSTTVNMDRSIGFDTWAIVIAAIKPAITNPTSTIAHSLTEQLRLTSSGLLELGTSSSTSKLSVNGDVNVLGGGSVGLQNYAGNAYIYLENTGSSNNSQLELVTTFNSTPSTKLVLTATGSVGIGTSNPGSLLEISDTASNSQTLRMTNTASAATNNNLTNSYFLKDAATNLEQFAQQTVTSSTITNGSERGTFSWYTTSGNGIQINRMQLTQGLVLNDATGATPTGGDKGVGTINIAGDIYKNNTAFTNPDYVFEHYYTGKIEKFAHKEGATSYTGLMPLDDLASFLETNLHLPGLGQNSNLGIFGGSDILLARIEESVLHLIDIHKRLKNVENKSENLSIDANGSLVIPSAKVGTLSLDKNLQSSSAQILTNQDQHSENSSANLVKIFTDVEDSLKQLENNIAGVATTSAVLVEKVDDNTKNVASQSALLSLIDQRLKEIEIKNSTTSATITSAATQNSDLSLLNLNTPPQLISTLSASIDKLESKEATISGTLRANDNIISNTLKSLGETFLSTTYIAGDIILDGTLSITRNSINAIGSITANTPTDGILFIQSSPLSNLVDFFNGLVTISRDGLVSIQKLAVSDQSIGSTTLKAGETRIVISNERLNSNSYIFTTPSHPISVAVTNIDVESKSFTLETNHPLTEDISIRWWVVDRR